MPVTHTITIKHRDDDPTKELVFEHYDDFNDEVTEVLDNTSPFQVNSGDLVQWKCDLGNFAILFKDEAPFKLDAVFLGHGKGKTTSARVAKRLGGTKAAPVNRQFEYAATVVEDRGDGLQAYTLDPLMDVSDGGGGQ